MIKKNILRFINLYFKVKYLKLNNIKIDKNSVVEFRKIDIKQFDNIFLEIGSNSLVNSSLVFEKDFSSIYIGINSFISGAIISCAKNIKIGNNVQIAWGTIIFDHNSHSLDYMERRNDLPNTFKGLKTWKDVAIAEVKIEDDVWIGTNVVILKGVTIGKGSIVGAGSVVTKDVPPMVIVAGNPAKIVKRLNNDSTNNA